MALISCPSCKREISSNATACPHCGEPINTLLKCPKCGGTDISVITGADKAISVAFWGLFAANTVICKNVCKKCRHKF